MNGGYRIQAVRIALLVGVTVAAGCSCDGPQAVAVQAQATTDAPHPASNANVVAGSEVSAFSYSSMGRRDPFRSYLSQVKERQENRVQDHRHEETENFEVTQFRLSGLITGTSQPKAMVEDPNGDAHMVRIGSRMGKNGGRVYSIGAYGITVLEEYVDASGKAVSVPIHVRLPQDVLDEEATKP